MITIVQLVEFSWQIAEEKGHHRGRGNSRDDTLVRLCLVHSEVAEAVQLVKKVGPNADRPGLAEELADIMIRVGDLAGCLNLDLEGAISDKLEKNRGRPYAYGTPNEGLTPPSGAGAEPASS